MLHAREKTSRAARVPQYSARLVVALWIFILTGISSAPVRSRAALADPVHIPGSPLTILVASDASFQVRRDAAFGSDPDLNGMVYPNLSPHGDAGIFVRYGLDTIGPDFDTHDTTALDGRYQAWTPVSAPALSGAGTLNDPYLTHASLEHASGVTLTVDVQYINGQDKFLLSWEVCPPAGGAGFMTYLAADVQLTTTLSEDSQSGFDIATGAISAYNPSSGLSEHLKPLTPAYAHMASNDIFTSTIPIRPLWDAIQAGQDLLNTIPSINDTGDNSLALEWRQLTSDCRLMLVEWHVLSGPLIPDPLTQHSYLPIIGKQFSSLP